MNKTLLIVVGVIIILAVAGFFIFLNSQTESPELKKIQEERENFRPESFGNKIDPDPSSQYEWKRKGNEMGTVSFQYIGNEELNSNDFKLYVDNKMVATGCKDLDAVKKGDFCSMYFYEPCKIGYKVNIKGEMISILSSNC